MTDPGGVAAGLERLGADLREARDVDTVALASLRAALALPGVVRAGLGLTVVGGRQLRFLPSDQHRLDTADWCLIDAFDRLPLNDVVRTGRAVVLGSLDAMQSSYPELAARQAGGPVRSLVALPLGAQERVGGVLLYGDHEVSAPTEHEERLAALVTQAVLAIRSGETARAALPDGTVPLPADATAPGQARRLLRELLADSPLHDDTMQAALLCLSELVTNVVMHAGRPPSMSIERTASSLVVRIHHGDPGTGLSLPSAREPDPLRISGRGLELVDALASEWGAESTEAGITTWFRLDL